MKKYILASLFAVFMLGGCTNNPTSNNITKKTPKDFTTETATTNKDKSDNSNATIKKSEEATSVTATETDIVISDTKESVSTQTETQTEETVVQYEEESNVDSGYRYLENGRVAHMDEGEHAGGPILHGDDEENDRRMAEDNIPYDIETNEYVYGKTDEGLTIGDTNSGQIQNEIANNTVYDDDWFNSTHEVEPEW